MGERATIEGLELRLAEAEATIRADAVMKAELRESEERQAYLLALSDALRPLADQEQIQAEAMRLLGEKIGVNRAQYYIADETGEYLSSTGGYSNGIPAAIGNFHLIEFGRYAYDGFHAGETQVLSDATTDPRISEDVLRSYETVGFMAYIGVPFVQRGRLVGTLAVHQSQPRQWTASERMMVEETAERTGIAVEQARAEAALRESQERQAVLLELTDALRPLDEDEEIIEQGTRILGDYLKADRTFVAEMEADGINMQVYDEHLLNGAPSVVGPHNFDLFGPFVGPILARGETLAVDDIANLTNLTETERAHYATVGIAAYLLVPLVRNGRFAAVFATNHRTGRPWSQADKDMARQTADRTWTAVERARAETALRESEARFQQFADASAAGLWIRSADTLQMEYVSPALARIYGVAPDALIGDMQGWAGLILPEDRETALAHINLARQGEAVVHEFRIQRPDDRTFRWIRNTDFPLKGDQGRVQRIGGLAEDVTEAKLAVEHQGVLLAELQHRVRNIMAIIRAIAERTGERADSVPAYAELIGGRLMALARVQALLTRGANVSVGIGSIVHDEISVQAQHEGQYDIEGPDVALSPKAAEVLTLAIHELATNALKYGALSVPDGCVTARWDRVERDSAPWLVFDWTEEGAPERPPPPPGTPRRRGFGSELIERRIPYELRGRCRIVIGPGGAECHLEFPLSQGASVLETGAPQRATVIGGALDMTGEADLSGRRVLVVEDEYYLAADSARALQGAGAEVIGPSATEAGARAELDAVRPDAVLLDINLGSGATFKLAETLKDRGVPFLFITGYDQEVIPAEFEGVERLQKPVQLRQIVTAIAKLLEAV